MMSRAARGGAWGAVVGLGVGAATVACVLADPPADLPVAPIQAPQIVRVEVQPPISFLEALPNQVYVPVTVDPREPDLTWQWAIDGSRNAFTPPGGTIKILGKTSVPITTTLPTPIADQECHTLELDVFYPASSLPADAVVWFYSPTGSFSDCPVYDAGPPDAGEDGAGSDGAGSGD